ncbi:DUF2786 domain-containing protein [Epilithonimonas arachidiradicis]|nr:DUF2786 domain-containing protein [Epilithonimonas arachidiradicis]RKE90033.1 hypothetical protein BXY58_0618 [Epilithonimonas arachidiradicis]
MNNEIKDKISKVLELVNQGVDGEKDAAKNALNRLMKKYNLSDEDLANIKMKHYFFKYKTNLDMMLFQQILSYFFPGQNFRVVRYTAAKKELRIELEYLDWVTLDSAYEYFRRHAAKQFSDFCLPHIKRCRTTKTKNAKRAELQDAFFTKYVIASKIYHPDQVTERRYSDMSNKEIEALNKRAAILGNVEGGQYHTQVAKETLKIGI